MSSKNNLYYTIEAFHKEVTGTCMILTIHFPNNRECKIMVDCGLTQEIEYEDDNRVIPYNINSIDLVCLTHSHLDHIGKLPFIVKSGYNGPIYCSNNTKLTSKLIMEDCAKINEQDYLKAKLIDKNALEPLYTFDHVETTLNLINGISYNQPFSPFEGVTITFFDNGHLIGASSILIQAKYKNSSSLQFLFTGDLKATSEFKDIIPIPDSVKSLKNLVIVQEATYGATDSCEETSEFEDTIIESMNKNNTVFIASIAQERLAVILKKLYEMQLNNLLDDDIPIIVDTTLGINCLKLYERLTPFSFIPKNISFIANNEMRELAVRSPKKKIIIASSGMCDKGISPFYIYNFLGDPTKTILLTSYLSEHTLGREIVEAYYGKKISVYRGKDNIPKLAQVKQINSFSSHSKRDELIEFLEQFSNISYVFINHGSNEAKEEYAKCVEELLNIKTRILGTDKYYKITSKGELFEFEKEPQESSTTCQNKHCSKKKSAVSRTIPVSIRKNVFCSNSVIK